MVKIYGQEAIVPILAVPGQRDQMIVGTNLLKHLLRQFKQDPSYWRVMSKADSTGEQGIKQFLSMLSGITRWKGDIIPDVIGTVKLGNAAQTGAHSVGKASWKGSYLRGKYHTGGTLKVPLKP